MIGYSIRNKSIIATSITFPNSPRSSHLLATPTAGETVQGTRRRRVYYLLLPLPPMVTHLDNDRIVLEVKSPFEMYAASPAAMSTASTTSRSERPREGRQLLEGETRRARGRQWEGMRERGRKKNYRRGVAAEVEAAHGRGKERIDLKRRRKAVGEESATRSGQ